jgi:hypothetical protein
MDLLPEKRGCMAEIEEGRAAGFSEFPVSCFLFTINAPS